MVFFVLTEQNSKQLDTAIFHAGPDNQQEAIAAFSTVAKAKEYLEAAGWTDRYVVAELESTDFLLWILTAHREGVDYLVLDPNREAHETGQPQNAVEIKEKLGRCAAIFQHEMQEEF